MGYTKEEAIEALKNLDRFCKLDRKLQKMIADIAIKSMEEDDRDKRLDYFYTEQEEFEKKVKSILNKEYDALLNRHKAHQPLPGHSDGYNHIAITQLCDYRGNNFDKGNPVKYLGELFEVMREVLLGSCRVSTGGYVCPNCKIKCQYRSQYTKEDIERMIKEQEEKEQEPEVQEINIEVKEEKREDIEEKPNNTTITQVETPEVKKEGFFKRLFK